MAESRCECYPLTTPTLREYGAHNLSSMLSAYVTVRNVASVVIVLDYALFVVSFQTVLRAIHHAIKFTLVKTV